MLVSLLCVLFALCLVACGAGGQGGQGGSQGGQQEPSGQGGAEQQASDESSGIALTSSIDEELADDSAWVGSLQLCWNNMLDTLNGGQPVTFDQGNSAQVDALNERSFDETMLSDDHYYTYAGARTVAARQEIEQAIQEKFGQKSDILDQLDWADAESTNEWLMYAMLYRKFTFEHVFDTVREDAPTFGSAAHANKATGVTYFGLDGASSPMQRGQAFVLYYNGEDDFAVSLYTEQNDRVVLVKNPQGTTAADMFETAMGKANEYEGIYTVREEDTLSVPDLNIDAIKEYKQLEGLSWKDPTGAGQLVEKVIQTLQFKLDKEGGEVKSEAAIMGKATAIAPTEDVVPPRTYAFNDRFALFLVDDVAPANNEDDGYQIDYAAQHPYLAVVVSDITKFQEAAHAE